MCIIGGMSTPIPGAMPGLTFEFLEEGASKAAEARQPIAVLATDLLALLALARVGAAAGDRWTPPVEKPLGLNPRASAADIERRHALDTVPESNACPECGGITVHIGPCSRLQ